MNWIEQGVEEIILLLHFESQKIISLVESLQQTNKFSDVNFIFIEEEKPLGTGGSILNALNILSYQDSFLVTNADTWISGGFEEISNSAPNTICALEMEDSNRYGLHLDAGRVTKFLEKEESAVNETSFINAGLCHLALKFSNILKKILISL